MLLKINESGSTYRVLFTWDADSYNKLNEKFSADETQVIRDYVVKTINESNGRFSLSTHFSNPWPEELMLIFNKINDVERSAIYLAQLVQDYLIFSGETWMSTKTALSGRGFETNFYWKSNEN